MTAHVLLTGGAGFVGTHLARALLARGERVTVLDDLSAPSSLPLPRVRDLVLRVGDVRDAAIVDAAAEEATRVIHLASVVGVDAVTSAPERTASVIRDGTARVLAACRRFGCPLTFFSSSEVADATRRGPRSVYAEAKRDAERLLLDRAAHVPVTIVRPFNVVGPGQTARGMVLPTLSAAARAGRALPVHGDGQQERAFLHVDDLVRAVLALPDGRRGAAEIVEIGSEERTTIEALAERLASLAGCGARVRRGARAPLREDRLRRAPDLAALRRVVPFHPRWTLEAILQQAVAHA